MLETIDLLILTLILTSPKIRHDRLAVSVAKDVDPVSSIKIDLTSI